MPCTASLRQQVQRAVSIVVDLMPSADTLSDTSKTMSFSVSTSVLRIPPCKVRTHMTHSLFDGSPVFVDISL